MSSRTFYHEILTDHNLHPAHKHDLKEASHVLEGVNPSCGDAIWLKLVLEEGRIRDGAFVGDGCAISQASADMMLDLVIGMTREEADGLVDEASEEEMEQLQEASVLREVSHMPARVKCAVLGWHTLKEILNKAR